MNRESYEFFESKMDSCCRLQVLKSIVRQIKKDLKYCGVPAFSLSCFQTVPRLMENSFGNATRVSAGGGHLFVKWTQLNIKLLSHHNFPYGLRSLAVTMQG